MDNENHINPSEDTASMSHEEKLAAMRAVLSEELNDLKEKYPSSDFEGAMDKLARFAVENGKDANQILKEVSGYKIESIHLKVDADDNRKVADKVLSPFKREYGKGEVGILAQKIGRVTAISHEDPEAAAQRCLEMGFKEALAEYDKPKAKAQEMSEEAKLAMAQKAELAKDVAEFLWPNIHDYKLNMYANSVASALARDSIDFDIPVRQLAEEDGYLGLTPELAFAKRKEIEELRKARDDKRTASQKLDGENAKMYSKEIKLGLWGDGKGDMDMSKFLGKASWMCVNQKIAPEAIIAEFKGKSTSEALEAFVAKYEPGKGKAVPVRKMSSEEAQQLRASHAARVDDIIGILGAGEEDVSKHTMQLATYLASKSMETNVSHFDLAEEYAAMDGSPEEKLAVFRAREAEALSQPKEAIPR